MQLQAETGTRISEVLGLHLRDITLSEKKMVVQKGKGDKTRVVYWRSDEMTMLLEKWLTRRPSSSFLFSTIRSNDKGSQMDPRSFRVQFDKYVRQAGLPTWTTTHVLRHSYATNFLGDGGNIRTLQIILGHASLATTEKYLHVTDKDVAMAMRGF